MDTITPYANESESLEIADLTIENRLDRISLYGDLQLTRDKQGLAQAVQLKAILDAVVATLRADPQLPDHVPVTPPDKVKNPFG
jgi:hypothetical protein